MPAHLVMAAALCAVPAPKALPASDSAALALLRSRKADLAACACKLVGESGCATLPRYKLTKEDAELVHAVTEAATHKETWDSPQLYAFQFQPRLARLAAALSYSLIGQRVDQDVEKNLPRRREMWQLANWALEGCERVLKAVSDEKPDSKKLSESLVCAFRDTGDLWKHPVSSRWPGTRCAGGEGVYLGHACLNGYTHEHFEEQPIDARVPGQLGKFVAAFEKRLGPGARVDEIGTIGCTFERLETGARVKELKEGDELSTGHVSNHSRGTACDIRYLVFREKGGEPRRFDLAPEGAGAANPYPLLTALQKTFLTGEEYEKRAELWPDRRATRVRQAGGADALYRDLERAVQDQLSAVKAIAHELPSEKKGDQTSKSGLTSEEWEALRYGVYLRNSLSEAGFFVMDPMTNSNHESHMHAELVEN